MNKITISNAELAQRIKNGEFALAEDFKPNAPMEIVASNKKKDHVSMTALLAKKQKTPEEAKLQNLRDVEYIGRMKQKWAEPLWLAPALRLERMPTAEDMISAAPFHDQNIGLAPRPHGVIRFVDVSPQPTLTSILIIPATIRSQRSRCPQHSWSLLKGSTTTTRHRLLCCPHLDGVRYWQNNGCLCRS